MAKEMVERISEHSDADACQRTLDLLNDSAAEIQRLQEVIARCYMRLQCADVPREPWHWEVCATLYNTGIPSSSKSCPYCLHPVRVDGSILHAGGCAGLDTVNVTRLQYDALTKANAHETREQRTRQAPIADDKLTLEVALREAERCRRYPDPVLNEQVIVVLADALHALKASERQPCSHGNATGHCQHCLDAL